MKFCKTFLIQFFSQILETFYIFLESLFGGATELGKAISASIDTQLSNYTSSLIEKRVKTIFVFKTYNRKPRSRSMKNHAQKYDGV